MKIPVLISVTALLFSAGIFSTASADVKRTMTIQPKPLHNLCPRHVNGDREFSGNGPEVRANAYLFTTNRGKDLKVRVYLKARETKRNWTTAERSWTFPIWSAPFGKKIVGWTPNGTARTHYVDQNHQLDIPSITGSNLVRRFEIKGDTKGNDVGNCTHDDVYMNVHFQPVSITYK